MNRCKILKDSVSPRGKRLTTYQIELPRQVLAEIVTHRMNSDTWLPDIAERTATPDISKNSASSRAIPFARMLHKVMTDPYIPEKFSANGPGMQATGYLEGRDHELAVETWMHARNTAVSQAICLLSYADRLKLHDMPEPPLFEIRRIMSVPPRYPAPAPNPSISVHKQDINRLLEPWGWVLQVVTATEWDNFFALRCDEAAAPAIRTIARMMYVLREKSTPERIEYGQWHLPYVDKPKSLVETQQSTWDSLCSVSAARCAWTSYWPTEGGSMDDAQKIQRTLMKLRNSKPLHASPFEHQATPMYPDQNADESLRSNFKGWIQLRKVISKEVVSEYKPSAETVAEWGITDEILAKAGE